MIRQFRVSLTAWAEEDLIAIWLAIAADSPQNADRLLDRLNNRIDTLPEFPERGTERPAIGKKFRLLIEGNYLILYRIERASMLVARIVHSARDLIDLVYAEKP